MSRRKSIRASSLGVLYLRMSKDSQEDSIPSQRKALTKLAEDCGYKIVREYVDSGISGDATEKRLGFQEMMADCSKGRFSVILCWDQDRFGRFDPLEAGYWVKPMRDAGVVLHTVAQGIVNWEDFAGRIAWTVTQEGKHAYLRDMSRNILRGCRDSVMAGNWISQPPFGYSKPRVSCGWSSTRQRPRSCGTSSGNTLPEGAHAGLRHLPRRELRSQDALTSGTLVRSIRS